MLASAPFPARGVNALAGLPDRRRRETRSPGQLVARLSAARAGKKPRRCITPTPSRRRRCAPVRATGSQTWGTRSPVSAAPPGKQAAEYFRPGLFPARGVNALAGLPDRRRQGTRSPGQLVARLSAARAGKKPRRCITPTPSRRRRCAPVRATGSQTRGTRSSVSAAPPGKQAAEYFRPGLFPARGVNALAGLPDRRRG